MARKHVGPAIFQATEGPTISRAWRDEFFSRSSWGPHPRAHHTAAPQREKHDDDTGPWGQHHLKEQHAGDD